MQKIIEGTAPEKFSQAHLKGIGFKSSNDMGIIPVLKDLGFLTGDGSPTQRYHDYRDKSRSREVMAEALHEAYEEVFHVNENPTEADRASIEGKFKSFHNASDRVAKEQAKTFFALLDLADLDAARRNGAPTGDENQGTEDRGESPDKEAKADTSQVQMPAFGGLRYNIEIHLPPTKDIEVYNAIFKSLKEHLIED